MVDLKIAFPDRLLNTKNGLPSNGTFSDNSNKHNIIGGAPYAKVHSASSWRNVNFEIDNGSTSPSTTIDHLILKRADIVKANGGSVRVGSCTTSRNEITDISGLKLWLDSTYGVSIDSSNLVGTWSDRSTSALSATQGTTANKPFLTRADDLGNFLKGSNNFHTGAVWAATGATVSGTVQNPLNNDTTIPARLLAEDGSTGNHKIEQTTADWIVKGYSYRVTLYASANVRTHIQLICTGTAITSTTDATFNVSTGSVASSTNCTASISSAIVTDEGKTFYRVQMIITPGADGNITLGIYLHTGATASYLGSIGNGSFLFGAQICENSDSTTYLNTSDTVGEMSGLDGFPALFFNDQSPDNLNLGNPSALALTGDLTIFAAVKLMRGIDGARDYHIFEHFVSTTSGYVFLVYGPNLKPEARTASGGANSTLTSTTAVTNSAAYVLTIHKSGTTGTHYQNGTSDGSGTLNNAATPGTNAFVSSTSTTTAFVGKIAEILVFNEALSGTNRAKVETYLKAKYRDTPLAHVQGLGFTTLKGPQQHDLNTSISHSSTNRYIWLDFNQPVAATSPIISKAFLGEAFDMGVELADFRIEKISGASKAFESQTGQRRSGIILDQKYKFTLIWDRVSDDKVKEFTQEVASLANATGFFIYTSSYHDPLDDQEVVYCKLTEFYTEQNGDKIDYNLVVLTFEEYAE